MSELTVLHNPRCSTSRAAMDQVGAAAVTADVVEYLKTPLDAAGLRELIAATPTSSNSASPTTTSPTPTRWSRCSPTIRV
jgi:arsenate reductase-like glutaredoxin family protein